MNGSSCSSGLTIFARAMVVVNGTVCEGNSVTGIRFGINPMFYSWILARRSRFLRAIGVALVFGLQNNSVDLPVHTSCYY